MTPPEQLQRIRIAIATAEGYRFEDEGWRYPDEPEWQKFRAVYSSNGGFIGLCKPDWMQIPDYTGSRDIAITAAVRLLKTDEQKRAYMDALWVGFMKKSLHDHEFAYLTAPAEPLALALCKALNLNIDPP